MPLIPSWHPTYAKFHNPFEWGAFNVDLDRFARLIHGELLPRPRIEVAPTPEHMRALLREPLVTLDIETKPMENEPVILDREGKPVEPGWSGKDATRCRLNLVGFGTTEWGLSYKWGTSPTMDRLVKELATSPHVVKVMQNGPWFDRRVMRRYGMDVRPWEDTRDARRAVSSTSPLKLGYLASLYDDVHQWKQGKTWDKPEYNAYDCTTTARVWQGLNQEEQWSTPRVQRLYRLHKSLSVICAEMHSTGFHVDKQNRRFMAWALAQEYEEKLAKLKAEVGMPAFRGNANDMRALIFERHRKPGIECFNLPDPLDPDCFTNPERMETISVDFKMLLRLLVDPGTPKKLKSIIELYWDSEEIKKGRGTFVTSTLIDKAIGADGRLRAGWNSCGTDTGRPACNEPNLLNIPVTYRAMYSATPGKVLVHADASQLELHVMGVVAPDRTLLKFLSTGDVYTEDAKAFFPGMVPADATKATCPKKVRGTAKEVHLSSQYGAGLDVAVTSVMEKDRSATWHAVKLVRDAWMRTYHETVSYWGEEMERVKATGYSETRIMHRRRVYPAEPTLQDVANYPIQGTAADIMNIAWLKIWKQLRRQVPSARIIVMQYDAFDVECYPRDASTVARILEDNMSAPHIINGVQHTFPVEGKTATHWNEF